MFPPARILVSVRSVDTCAQVVQQAIHLARQFGAKVTLFHVVPPDQVELRRHAESILDQIVQNIPDVRIERTVIEGEPATAILRFVREQDADLLVMSRNSHGMLHLFLHGSKVEEVLHEAPCPVWFGDQLGASPGIATVLCAVDLGPNSEAVLRWGKLISKHFAARLAVAHVPPKVEAVTGAYAFDPEIQAQYEAAVRDEVLQLTPPRSSPDCYILRGDPVEQICSLATEIGAGLLVIGGAQGSGQPGRFRMHAYEILRQAPCAVMSVHTAAEQPESSAA